MRLLFVEDNPAGVERTVAELRRFGFEVAWERVETLQGLLLALESGSWSAILSNSTLPGFEAQDALAIVREWDRDLPFIVISDAPGDERGLDMIRAGANDYLSSDRLVRLGLVLERELRDVQLREERRALFTALNDLSIPPSDQVGGFYEKAMAIQGFDARLAFVNRGQGWVVRKLRGLLPRVRDDGLHEVLRLMLAAHERNIGSANEALAARGHADPAA